MPVINSDREDAQNESDNEIDRPVDSKEKKGNEKNKKRPVIVNERNLSGNIIQSRDLFFTRKDALSY